jgi:microcystin-dependent protein
MADSYTGEIRLFAGNYAPDQWAKCEGQALNIQAYPALYSLIGVTYGGDGVSTFKLPDLRGRVPVGMGTPTGSPNTYARGTTGGAETVTLTSAQMPAHTHSQMASTGTANTLDPTNAILADPGDKYDLYITYAANNPTLAMSSAAITSTGGGQKHSNMMPSTALTYIISLNGLYPQA